MEAIVDQVSEYEQERGKPMPSTNHAVVQQRIGFQFMLHYGEQYDILPELHILLDKPYVPDLAVYPKLTIDFSHDVLQRTDLPITAIEILSPRQSLEELIDKVNVYFAAGVKSCWIAVPAMRSIAVYSSPNRFTFYTEQDTLRDEALPVELPLETIFK